MKKLKRWVRDWISPSRSTVLRLADPCPGEPLLLYGLPLRGLIWDAPLGQGIVIPEGEGLLLRHDKGEIILERWQS